MDKEENWEQGVLLKPEEKSFKQKQLSYVSESSNRTTSKMRSLVLARKEAKNDFGEN